MRLAQIQRVEKESPPPGARSGKVRLQRSLDTSYRSRGAAVVTVPQLLMFTDPRCISRSVIYMEYWWGSNSGLYADVHVFSEYIYECAYVHIVLKHVLNGRFVFYILHLRACN